jgi:2-oxoacid:acceptor oxidoreductase delta subunit (pyruvate/2-ketoisovalerate family)
MNKPFAITLDEGSSRANHTGAWRERRPEYVSRLSPCNNACPAGEDVQRWLYLAEQGDYRAAWEALMESNPLPAIMGRVCYHTCETACNRGKLDEAVSIHGVERFLGDLAIREGFRLDPKITTSGKKVLVVGSGPSGLSAAYHLARAGHAVTIRESAPKPGGMMRYGIPAYRLPREVVDAEVARILDLGVTLELSAPVRDLRASIEEGGYSACFAAIGAHLANRVEIPGADAGRVLDAVTLLRDVELGREPPRIGRRVIVYGGGNTAIDVARTVKRLGAEEACIVYRRRRSDMPAHDFEVTEALDEGIVMRWLRTVKRVESGSIVVEEMERRDGKLEATGRVETLEADTLVLAIGQNVDLSILETAPGVIVQDHVVKVDSDLMTGFPGLFAGGDMVPAERTVTVAVGHGRRAARSIDAYLTGRSLAQPAPQELASYEKLNTWYYSDADRTVAPTLDALRRGSSFAEVHAGLTPENALFEARRCLSCGNCFECDNCYGMCPDNAVIKLGPGKGFRFDLDFCKGCGICATECPAGAIRMVPEDP